MRKVIVTILEADTAIDVVGQAADGNQALEMIEHLQPEVVTLDLVMPGMDGLETLQQIMRRSSPPAVLIVSAHSSRDAEATLDCLAAGAVDFVLKPSQANAWGLDKVAPLLREKVRAVAEIQGARSHAVARHPHASTDLSSKQSAAPRVVVIGSSTGGPVALERIIPLLSADIPYPVVVAQHMPSPFVHSLAERLAPESQVRVTVGKDGETLSAGTVYLCQGEHDTELVRAGEEVRLLVRPSTDILSPSVDKLFTSAAHVFTNNVLGVVLTGMGQDGTAGARTIKNQGGRVVIENKESAMIFGMGRSVAEAGLADASLSLDAIADTLRAGTHG